jgi:hypothetical protein
MFIEISGRLSQATELGELLCDVFYKHYAPLALQNQGIREQYQRGGRAAPQEALSVFEFLPPPSART